MTDSITLINIEEIKLKKEQINNITKELKSHVYIDDFFVDPDKNFMSLLEKIINFFEEDDFVVHIKQNEHLYENFKKKYECALELVKTVEEEKEKLQNTLKKNNNNNKYYRNSSINNNTKEDFYGNSPFDKSVSMEGDSPKFNTFHYPSHHINAPRSSDFSLTNNDTKKSDFDRLKEDYLNLVSEKKSLEYNILDLMECQKKYLEQSEKLNSLQTQFDLVNDKYKNILEEKFILQDRLNKIAMENYDLIQNMQTIKENLNNSERERNNVKNKITTFQNKIKSLEKEAINIKKKSQTMNYMIKNLTEKLKSEENEKYFLEKRNEDNCQEFENKLAMIENEKNKVCKDSYSSLINAIISSEDKEKVLEFKFNRQNNKIEIYFEKTKIAEANNEAEDDECTTDRDLVNYNEESKNHSIEMKLTKNFLTTRNYSNTHLILNTENSILNLKTLSKNFCSPTKIDSATKNKNISLNKLFSNSSNNKKSPLVNENKENININVFNNININSNGKKSINTYLQKSNSSKKVVVSNITSLNDLSNFSAPKNKTKTTVSKLERIEELNYQNNSLSHRNMTNISNFQIYNNDSSIQGIENCIKKANINNLNMASLNLRYALSSAHHNNKHNKVVSLDEALRDEDCEDIYLNVSNVPEIKCNKKLSFLTVSKNHSIEISPEKIKNRFMLTDECSFAININNKPTINLEPKILTTVIEENKKEENPTEIESSIISVAKEIYNRYE